MKTCAIGLLAGLILFGFLHSAGAFGYGWIAEYQRVYVEPALSPGNGPYWAMVWDYTAGYRESATPGFLNSATFLAYACQPRDVQVAYVYDQTVGQYVAALALRYVDLFD